MGSASLGSTVYYCCVHKGNRTLYSYNSGDQELESLASLCLDNAPSFHAWYFHTMGQRTFGFLMEDGNTYFAIADPSLGNSGILHFLELVRDGHKKVGRSGFQEELVPVIRRLISSLESMSSPGAATPMPETPPSSDVTTSTKAPLLGKSGSSKHDRKKMKERVIDVRDDEDRRGKIDVPSEPVGAISLQKCSSSMRVRSQQIAKRTWWRKVKVVILIDVFLCLVLFGIWLAICRGFQCVSGG